MQSNRNILLLLGIAGLILSAIGQGISLGAPTLDEGGAKLQEWLADNRNLAITAFYMVGLGLTLSITLVVAIRQRLLSAEGGSGLLANTFALSSVLWIAMVGTALGAYGAMIYNADTMSAESAQMLNSVTYLTISMGAFPTAIALIGASVVIIRTRTLHIALGYAGLVTAAVHLVSAVAFDTGSGLMNPQNIGGLAAVLFYIYGIATAVLLLRAKETEASAVSLAAAAAMGQLGTLSASATGTSTTGASEAARQGN